jgi:pimeloyl-ACP methyl ester carboxylesterase
MLIMGCAKGTSPEPAPSAPSASVPAGLDAFYSQEPTWKSCNEGFECATVRVPLDYAKPDGTKLSLAVVRLPAGNKSQRIGSLVTNPGGPGASGIAFVRQAGRAFGSEVRERFDIVGFDPRGVGDSSPVECLDGPRLDRFFGTDASPDDAREREAIVAEGRGFAEACKSRSPALLPYVGTVNAARDIDVLRAALGDVGLTFAGFSYGTYLGAFYAQQFPQNTRALVLDGAVDPKLSATEGLLEQARGFETALRAFVADCQQTAADCPLGTGSVEAGLDKIADLQRQTDRKPLSSTKGGSREINESWVTYGIAAALYNRATWPMLRLALTRALTQGNGDLMLTLADTLVERRPDGSYSNQMEANMAVNCVDKPNPSSTAAYEREVAKAEAAAPHFGSFVMWGGVACVYWPAQTKEPPRPVTAAGAEPILVVGTTRDPATPYRWAQALATQLQSGVLLTYQGDGHTAYLGGPPCITKAVDQYLITTTPPQDGTVCR